MSPVKERPLLGSLFFTTYFPWWYHRHWDVV